MLPKKMCHTSGLHIQRTVHKQFDVHTQKKLYINSTHCTNTYMEIHYMYTIYSSSSSSSSLVLVLIFIYGEELKIFVGSANSIKGLIIKLSAE